MTYLSKKQLKKLKKLNIRIKEIQSKIIIEAYEIDKELVKRVNLKNDLLYDYELKILVSFYLKESHKDYKEDSDNDNVLVTLFEYEKGILRNVKKTKHKWGNVNHNDFIGWTNNPMTDDYHCWWFHYLYNHTHLDFKDLLDIGFIWSDIKVTYKYVNNKDR